MTESPNWIPGVNADVVCEREKNIFRYCQQRPGKRGPKFWCFRCGRYVVEDRYHRAVPTAEARRQAWINGERVFIVTDVSACGGI